MGEVIHHGDCLHVLREMPNASIDACITDPPYGLSFMGKGWDYDVPSAAIWREVYRVLKPGAHLLAFFGSRTYHRGVVQIEDAGFEVRDQIMWIYGSGFPKSHNLNGEWEGWGTALKPSHEPIVVARKPFGSTVAENVQTHGTGALNIDGCRVHAYDSQGYAYTVQRMMPGADQNATGKTHQEGVQYQGETKDGRWPANVVHDGSEEVMAEFPSAPGQLARASTSDTQRAGQNTYGVMRRGSNGQQPRTDAGSAARFFYCAKASKADRGEGNIHPTVKPTDLMRYLCRLVTPPSGIIIDPFMGSGSTGKAAIIEGFGFIGIEREADYIGIARARIGSAADAVRKATP